MQVNPKRYYAPTPMRLRKLGDSILILGTTLTATFAGMEVDKGWIIAAAITTAVGKMVTNFFSEDPEAITTKTIEIEYPADQQGNVNVTTTEKTE